MSLLRLLGFLRMPGLLQKNSGGNSGSFLSLKLRSPAILKMLESKKDCTAYSMKKHYIGLSLTETQSTGLYLRFGVSKIWSE